MVHQVSMCRGCELFCHNNIHLPVLLVHPVPDSHANMAVAQDCKLLSPTSHEWGTQFKIFSLTDIPSRDPKQSGNPVHKRSRRALPGVVPVAVDIHQQGRVSYSPGVSQLLLWLHCRRSKYKIKPLCTSTEQLSSKNRETNQLFVPLRQVVGLINFVLYALGGQLLHNKLRVYQDRQPKVCIVRTTLDKNGKPIKKTIKKQHHHQVKIHKIETVWFWR